MFSDLVERIRKWAFVRRVRGVVSRDSSVKGILYDKKGFLFKVHTDEESTMFLHNLYEEYKHVGFQAKALVIQRHVNAVMEARLTPRTFEEAKPLLMPRVRERSYFEVAEMNIKLSDKKSEEFQYVYKPLGTTHAVCLELDFPNSTSAVTRSTLETWHTSFDEANDVAVHNLELMNAWELMSPKVGVYISLWNDNFDPSRILLSDFRSTVKVFGDPVVMIPNRNTLLVTGSDDEEGLALIAKIAEEKVEEPRFMSFHAMRLAGNRWVDFLPPPGHPEFPTFHRLQLHSMAREYGEQKSVLDQHHETNSVDVFVATFMLYQNEKDGVFSVCTWGKGISTYLPKTDRVALMKTPEDTILYCGWDQLQSKAGHLMVPLGYTPERWHVTSFPDDAIIEAIRLEAD